MLAAGPVTYKIYVGKGDVPASEGKLPSVDGHSLLIVPGSTSGSTSVEIWPTPADATMGFLGCEINPISIPHS